MRSWVGFGAASLVSMTAVIAACGSSGSSNSTSTAAGGGTSSTTSTSGTGGASTSTTTSSTTTTTSSTTTSSTTTTTTSSSSSSSTSGGTCAGLGDACSDCTFDNTTCNSLYCTCYGDPDCGQIVSCVDNCAGSSTCAQNCLLGHTTGISEAALLDDCAARKCATQCPEATALTQCELCLFDNAPMDMDACLADTNCVQWLACVENCAGDDLCILGCNGDGNAQAVETDVENDCSSQCGG